MSKLAKALTAAAGNAAGESLYVEDVFSTYLYAGTGGDGNTAQTITNGIDLEGEGGLVWIQERDDGSNSYSYVADSERGSTKYLTTQVTNAEGTQADAVTSFNSDGFTLGLDSIGRVNYATGSPLTGRKYASWTFRKAEKFFDVVTYTGDGTNNRQIPHNLGSDIGMVICKAVSGISTWAVKHKDRPTDEGQLDSSAAFAGYGNFPTSFAGFTDTYFTVNAGGSTNSNGATYVAYLFASDAGGFGDDGSESIIKCGSSTVGATESLGWEPQFIIMKRTAAAGQWYMIDNMRGWVTGGNDLYVSASASGGDSLGDYGFATADGFTSAGIGSVGDPFIYIAIRRPMKTPESGTEVFGITNNTSASTLETGFVTDLYIQQAKGGASWSPQVNPRLTGQNYLSSSSRAAEATDAYVYWDSNTGVNRSVSGDRVYWAFKRATGFFDVVCYEGDGTAGRTVNHNLGVAPEMIIVKPRDDANDWSVYNPNGRLQFLNRDSAEYSESVSSTFWGNNSVVIAPTDTQFTVSTDGAVNSSAYNYIAYLFATLAGVSKVGSYTGTGSNVDVDCGFSAGARFILIKRTDSTGDWYVWDSVRGIVAGNDPYLLLNSTAAEVTSTDYIDPLSSGFTVTSSAPAALNASGGTYIFMAIS